MRIGLDKRTAASPLVGLAWSTTGESGLGVEVNVDRTDETAAGDGRGYSFDGRVLYAFGHGAIRPFVSGGAGFFQHEERYTINRPPSAFEPNGYAFSGRARLEGLAPIVGGGVRLQPSRHLVIRPEVSWFLDSRPGVASRTGVPRVGVSVGATW
jgi:hypothetical protein